MLKLMLKLETPGGHILLQGLPGVGKMSLARLAAHHTHARLLTCFFPPTKMPDVTEEQLKNLKQLFRAYREAIKKTGNPQDGSWAGVMEVIGKMDPRKPCRLKAQLKAEASQGGEVAVRRLDTSDLNSVRTFAKEILDTEKHIHVLDRELGAQTNIYLAVSEEVEGVSGRYFTDCKEVKTSKLARDKDLAKRLWEVSEKAVKLTPGENVCLGADEDEASGWDGLAAAGTANGSTSVLLPADDSAVQAAAGSTSRVPVYPEQHAETLYLMDEGELQHRQKRRKLELTLLEEKIKAQRAITLAMRLIAQVCEKIME
ncbi:hypothetical protein Pcinc_009082 [Petrolisthes cinctipes]|uniref:Uncharacterized protein n=1 Tax=Petrolisthes cinctipes TaxID=88211 RepID=A0AAE1KWV5_PETCI|nr:hypothetical protein Pcinc_009082 [Petrolisthes cinctipes]